MFTCPLELIKIRFQSSNWSKLSGSFPPPSIPSSPTKPQASLIQTSFKFTTPTGARLKGPTFLWRYFGDAVVTQQSTKCELCHQHVSEVSRLNASVTAFNTQPIFSRGFHSPEASAALVRPNNNPLFRSKIIRCMVEVGRTEGYGALFKGFVPTLVGVLPSR